MDHDNIGPGSLAVQANAYAINATRDRWGSQAGPDAAQRAVTPPASLRDLPVLRRPAP